MLSDAQAKALAEIMQYRFATLETALYLDTHPNDTEVLARHNELARELHTRCMNYQKEYNDPLSIYHPAEGSWSYIDRWEFGKGGRG